MFSHTLQAHADHLTEAHLCRQVAFSNGIEAGNQHPLRLKATLLKRDRIDGRRLSGVPVRILDRSPHKSLRRDDFFENAVDREAHPVGSLHDMVPCAAGAQIHFAHRIGETRAAVPLSDMFRIGDGSPDQRAWRVEHAGNDDHRLFQRTDIYCRCHAKFLHCSLLGCRPTLTLVILGLSLRLTHNLEVLSQAIEAFVPEPSVAFEPLDDIAEWTGLEVARTPLRISTA